MINNSSIYTYEEFLEKFFKEYPKHNSLNLFFKHHYDSYLKDPIRWINLQQPLK